VTELRQARRTNAEYLRSFTAQQHPRRVVFASDLHIGFHRSGDILTPYHDRAAIDAVLQFCDHLGVDEVVFGGDCLDMAEWGKYSIDAGDYFTTQAALNEFAWWLAQFRRLKPSRLVYMIGNHEERINRKIRDMVVPLSNLRTARGETPTGLDYWLDLPSLGVDYIADYPHGEYWITPTLRAIHGAVASSVPGGTARKMVQSTAVSTVFGHIHRREMVTATINDGATGREITAVCPGCLCHIDGRVPGSAAMRWQQGVALVEDYGDQHQVTTLPITGGVVRYDGVALRGRDRRAEIERAIK
jgi:hypothetical protein